MTPRYWRADLRRIIALGAPLIGNNFASIGVNVGDTLMAARLGAESLAGVAIGAGIWIVLFLLGLGTLMALGPTVAQHFGAGSERAIGHDTRQGLWLAALISVPVIVTMRSVAPALAAAGIEPAVAALAQTYLHGLSWGVPAAYGYHALKQMSEGVGRTLPIMAVVTIALPINVLLNYSFMFGRLGAPDLGAAGCGFGSAIAFWLMLAMLGAHVASAPPYRRFALWRGDWSLHSPTVARLVALGLPIGVSLCLQSGLFTAAALLIGAFGSTAVAAHQITLNYCGLVFMLPLGFAMALTVCVGHAIGRGEPRAARRIGVTGIALCGACGLLSALVTLTLGPRIVALYTRDAAVAQAVSTLFVAAAWLQVADGLQVAAAFALRGLKDTRVPLLLNALDYWGIGFTLAYVGGVLRGGAAPAIWSALALALWCAAALLITRFLWLARRVCAAAPRS